MTADTTWYSGYDLDPAAQQPQQWASAPPPQAVHDPYPPYDPYATYDPYAPPSYEQYPQQQYSHQQYSQQPHQTQLQQVPEQQYYNDYAAPTYGAYTYAEQPYQQQQPTGYTAYETTTVHQLADFATPFAAGHYEPGPFAVEPDSYDIESYDFTSYELELDAELTDLDALAEVDAQDEDDDKLDGALAAEDDPDAAPEPLPAAGATGGRAAARAARGRPARRRSAVLTIAVPSVAVLGIAGAAAAGLVPNSSAHTHSVAADAAKAGATAAQALALADAQAKASAEQASRDQARQALALRTAAAKKKAAEAPRYILPISFHTGLSALFGQAGTHWMQLHTGIDFPVSTGTAVHAVTDGVVSTRWNPFYGNMLILTAPDGTVTWYCHLSAFKIRSGPVKAGDMIAYSGDTGNSTGPHLHFEVHPNGGDAIDPLPWLLAHGLDPR